MKELYLIDRDKEYDLISRLILKVNHLQFNPNDTAIMMVSPDYSATVAMHLSHAWSKNGEIIPIIPVDVPYPDELSDKFVEKFNHDFTWHIKTKNIKKIVMVEAGIIRGMNWLLLLDQLYKWNFTRDQITLIALCESIQSICKSDYVGEYYNKDIQDLTFYYEQYNKHWVD